MQVRAMAFKLGGITGRDAEWLRKGSQAPIPKQFRKLVQSFLPEHGHGLFRSRCHRGQAQTGSSVVYFTLFKAKWDDEFATASCVRMPSISSFS